MSPKPARSPPRGLFHFRSREIAMLIIKAVAIVICVLIAAIALHDILTQD